MPGRAAAAASASVAAAPFKRSQSCLRLPRGDDAAAGKGGRLLRPSPPSPRRDGDSVDDELVGQKMRVHAPVRVGVVAAYTVHLLARPLVSFGRSARPGLESNGGGGGHNALDRMDWLGRV